LTFFESGHSIAEVRRRTLTLVALCGAALSFAGAAAASTTRFDTAVQQLLAEPYQADYVPLGLDAAFAGTVTNTAPAQDYTSGSIPGSPDHPDWPPAFKDVLLHSADGAPLTGRLALHPGSHPGLVVVHGFNTNGKESVVRWAAMLYANGYNVLAADQRDFKAESDAGYGYPDWVQTFGWKEAEDVLAAGRFLAAQAGVNSVGLVGWSLGGQDTVLALALDAAAKKRIFVAGLNFSGPASQNEQVYSTAEPAGCATPLCTYPATGALIALVVPPYTYSDPCAVLDDAAARYANDPYTILSRETAFRAQTRVKVPLLNVYAADDPLVQDFQARMMAGYEVGNRQQLTLEIERGAHAYFYDRWWQQRAMLLYFKQLLPKATFDATIGTTPTVNQTPGGAPVRDQLVNLGYPTREIADSYLAPYICDTTRPSPAS
jgi:predicted alpha/beta-fold hydrolase